MRFAFLLLLRIWANFFCAMAARPASAPRQPGAMAAMRPMSAPRQPRSRPATATRQLWTAQPSVGGHRFVASRSSSLYELTPSPSGAEVSAIFDVRGAAVRRPITDECSSPKVCGRHASRPRLRDDGGSRARMRSRATAQEDHSRGTSSLVLHGRPAAPAASSDGRGPRPFRWVPEHLRVLASTSALSGGGLMNVLVAPSRRASTSSRTG